MSDKRSERHLHLIDTGRSAALEPVRYEDLMRALGNYIDERGMSDVIITQIPDGILLKGTVIDKNRVIPLEKITATLFTNDDVVALLEKNSKRRGTGRLRPTRWPIA